MPEVKPQDGEWTRVCDLDEVPVGELKAIEVGNVRVVVANVDGDLYALEDQCSHQDFPLSAGLIEGRQVECVFHGARFDLETGKPTCLPAVRPVRTFDVKVDGGEVLLRVA
ncbi:MAG: non-heme iron oxygenase ferredoxin subunit [Gemmatimonadetes bacterium]|nr:non-heme iron oxygenase ferredoxin subunit [Gemmatimonadota bacterium]NNM31540.1 non-heme iron oxygenase ferredoxin subunit [Gemmatimonadota bacterium]